ncbi:hypothetical protein TNCV_1042031 [Trichonephila clavipes]|nr:hypothetical protein TNCV_1042031 [Trichonephila clavipes]
MLLHYVLGVLQVSAVPGVCQMTGTLPPLLDSVVGGGTLGRSFLRVYMDPMLLCQGKGLVLPNLTIDDVAKHSRFLTLSLTNYEMSKKSPFAIQKALKGIGGDPKLVRKLRSEARKLIAPQPSQIYAQITKPTAISTTIQTDPSITKIVCPPLQCLSPTSSTSSSMTAVSTSSSSAQAHLLPSTSAEIPTIQKTETRPLATSKKFTALQPPLSESASTTPNSELSNTSKVPQNVKQNSKNRRKRTKSRNKNKNG